MGVYGDGGWCVCVQCQILVGVVYGQLGVGIVVKDEGDVGVVGVDDQLEVVLLQLELQL